MRNATGEFDHLKAALNVALGVGNGFAVLARQEIGELVVIALRQLKELHHHAGAALRIGRAPLHLRGFGVLDRRAPFSRGGQRDLGRDVAVHWLKYVREPARCALDLTAADKMSDCAHAFLQYLRGCRFGGILQSLQRLERVSTRSAFAKKAGYAAFSAAYDQRRMRLPRGPVSAALL